MGLDMYLSAENSYYNARWNEDLEPTEETKINDKIREIIPEMYKSNNLNVIKVEFEIGYWRKANAIHNWFVKNVQDGKDECQDATVSKKDLEKLLALCKKVVANSKLIAGKVTKGYTFNKDGTKKRIRKDGKKIKDSAIAKRLLPAAGGFFFGNTDYDEGYIFDINNTIEIIEKALTLPKGWKITYHSSW